MKKSMWSTCLIRGSNHYFILLKYKIKNNAFKILLWLKSILDLQFSSPHLPADLLVCFTCTERRFVLWRPGSCGVISTAKIEVYEMPLCLHVFSWPDYLKDWQGWSSWLGKHRRGVFVCIVGAVGPPVGEASLGSDLNLKWKSCWALAYE